MIYVPEKDSYKCYVVQSEGTIRAYESVPSGDSTINYRDYYVNSSYLYKDGSQSFGGYYTTYPTCIDDSELTSNIYYRNDFDKICIILFVVLFVVYYIIRKFIRSFFFGLRYA